MGEHPVPLPSTKAPKNKTLQECRGGGHWREPPPGQGSLGGQVRVEARRSPVRWWGAHGHACSETGFGQGLAVSTPGGAGSQGLASPVPWVQQPAPPQGEPLTGTHHPLQQGLVLSPPL